MCRLFSLRCGWPVTASFWLLDAPDSLRAQSRRMPDGTGLGWFELTGEPVVERSPVAAYLDQGFAHDARDVYAQTFVAHIRYASTGAPDVRNTHPFVRDGRLFAHNGVVRDVAELESWLEPKDRAELAGGTDSERVFWYVTAEIRRTRDTASGLIQAVRRIGAELGVYALNLILAEPRRVWALRYPETHELWVLPRPTDGFTVAGAPPLRLGSPTGRMRVRVVGPANLDTVVIASERLDDDPAWRLLDPGELLVVDETLTCRSQFPFEAPAHQLTRADLSEQEAASQHPLQRERQP